MRKSWFTLCLFGSTTAAIRELSHILHLTFEKNWIFFCWIEKWHLSLGYTLYFVKFLTCFFISSPSSFHNHSNIYFAFFDYVTAKLMTDCPGDDAKDCRIPIMPFPRWWRFLTPNIPQVCSNAPVHIVD